MEFYGPAKNMTASVSDFSGGRLRRKEDLERLIDLSIKHNRKKELEEAAFDAKFLQGLFSIVQRGESALDEPLFAKYMQEYTEAMTRVKDNLSQIISGAGEFYNKIFTQKYLSLTQESVSNLNDLCYDLSWLKMYMNEYRK